MLLSLDVDGHQSSLAPQVSPAGLISSAEASLSHFCATKTRMGGWWAGHPTEIVDVLS